MYMYVIMYMYCTVYMYVMCTRTVHVHVCYVYCTVHVLFTYMCTVLYCTCMLCVLYCTCTCVLYCTVYMYVICTRTVHVHVYCTVHVCYVYMYMCTVLYMFIMCIVLYMYCTCTVHVLYMYMYTVLYMYIMCIVLYMYCTLCYVYVHNIVLYNMRGVTQSKLYYVMIIISILPSHEERRDTRFHTLKETLQLQMCDYILLHVLFILCVVCKHIDIISFVNKPKYELHRYTMYTLLFLGLAAISMGSSGFNYCVHTYDYWTVFCMYTCLCG